jgi:hypothetical protein
VRRAALAVSLLAFAGCAAEQPPAAAPPGPPARVDHGRAFAVLHARARTLDVYDATTRQRLGSAPAGIGPARLAADGANLLYVTDRVGQAVLVFHLRPRFELIRRVPLRGSPYAISFDRARGSLWITLPETHRVLEYAAGARPVPRHVF